MAGIGFELKKLFHEKSATGYFKAYAYTSIITTGPFILMTGMVIGVQMLFRWFGVSYTDSQLYTVSIIYPFIFSHIASSGFSMLITRYIADLLYEGSYEDVVPSLYGMLSVALFFGAIPALCFFWNKPLTIEMKLTTYVFYMEMILIWIEGVYLSALKDYKKIIASYACGVFAAILLTVLALWDGRAPMLGTMLAMNVGGIIIAGLLLHNIGKFFPLRSHCHYKFLAYFEAHRRLFFISLFYTVSLYIPNLIIWQGPLGVTIANTYVYAPAYDVAAFYAFLSILPVMALFVVSTEIYFYEKYATYFMYITEKGNFREIEDARKDLLHVMWSEVRNVIELQLVCTLIFLALGNYFLPRAGLAYNSIDMYNLIVLGAFSIGVMQVIDTLLLYFEDQKGVLWICASFLAINTGLHLLGLWIGEVTYGFMFFIAAFIGLCCSLQRLDSFTKQLDYQVFCSRPVFYQQKEWLISRFVGWLYREEGKKNAE